MKPSFLKTKAVVLGFSPFGKGHRVYTFFTEEKGKVKGSAFGSGKPNSKLGAALKTGNIVELVLKDESSGFFNVAGVSIIGRFVPKTLEDVFAVFVLSEAVDLLFPLNVSDRLTFKTLFSLFGRLSTRNFKRGLVFKESVRALFLVVSRSGFMPEIPDVSKRRRLFFDGESWGEKDGLKISTGAVMTMRSLFKRDVDLSLPVAVDVVRFCFKIVKRVSGRKKLVSEELMEAILKESNRNE